MKITPKITRTIVLALLTSALLFFTIKSVTNFYAGKLVTNYESQKSIVITDRNNTTLAILPNTLGNYTLPTKTLPRRFVQFLITKEDKHFYLHLGTNPISIARAFWHKLFGQANTSSSTITQQLAKILLGHENNRTIRNKLSESFYALCLEISQSKEKILAMYLDSVYFGHQAQGLAEASRYYFNLPPEQLSEPQMLKLLATISNPSNLSPLEKNNTQTALALSQRLGLKYILEDFESVVTVTKTDLSTYRRNNNYFELDSLGQVCQSNCNLTIDNQLADTLRSILKRNLESLQGKKTFNGAIVIIKQPENQLLAIVGSPDPTTDAYGYKINMAIKPRPIGSTIKPFIYAKGFEKNLRPYSLVDDKEYKYLIDGGFAFYPKNYDYKYHGIVNLHYALSNSLNVPTVKVLEYVGIDTFNNFLEKDLKLKTVQPIANYQLSLALGGFETDLLTLSYYFSTFAQNGKLTPLKLNLSSSQLPNSINYLNLNKKIFDQKYVELINKVLSDRLAGVEQFGLASNLNLPHTNYALKTGTSREYHDSWTMGYTPDFLVGVWVGNSDNSAMDQVSGTAGAGKIWREAMNLMYNSEFNKNTPFDFKLIKEYPAAGTIEYGLANDDYELSKNVLLTKKLILKPYDGDEFLLEPNTQIILSASEPVDWLVNDALLNHSDKAIFQPKKTGLFIITAKTINKTEAVTVYIKKD